MYANINVLMEQVDPNTRLHPFSKVKSYARTYSSNL
jgi:hypothetical protein